MNHTYSQKSFLCVSMCSNLTLWILEGCSWKTFFRKRFQEIWTRLLSICVFEYCFETLLTMIIFYCNSLQFYDDIRLELLEYFNSHLCFHCRKHVFSSVLHSILIQYSQRSRISSLWSKFKCSRLYHHFWKRWFCFWKKFKYVKYIESYTFALHSSIICFIIYKYLFLVTCPPERNLSLIHHRLHFLISSSLKFTNYCS